MNCRYGRNEYNGSGLLIYRGALTGQAGPIASIRLKAHRRGFQDYEYFYLLREARLGSQADAMVNSILVAKPFGPGSWRLYDTEADPGETMNLSEQHPALLDELTAAWDDYAKDVRVVLSK